MDKKIFIFILIVAVVFIGGYFLTTRTQTPSETSTSLPPTNQDSPRAKSGIRAGLDYQLDITESGRTKTINCDICSHTFQNGETILQSLAVNKKEGSVEAWFVKSSGGTGRLPDYQNIIESKKGELTVEYYAVFRITKGQTVLLNNADIKIKLIDVTGGGCPAGAQC